MTWPIVELTFWSPGDGHNPAIDPLLADPTTPLAKHGLTGIAAAYARETGAFLHDDHKAWAEHLVGRSLGVDGALAHVVPLFDAHGFDYFVAKGPVIAHTVYPDPGLRPYCDLDVYVGAAHHAAARQVLAEAGYAPVHHAVGVLGGLAQEMHGGPYGATVELHAHVIDNLHRKHLPPIEAFLPHVERRTIAGVDTPVLADGAHLALQAIHAGAGHRYQKLALLRDFGVQLHLIADVMPTELGATANGSVMRNLVERLGRPSAPTSLRTLERLVVAALVRRDPAGWDEYRLTSANALALAHQPGSLAALAKSARFALPRRGRRINTRTLLDTVTVSSRPAAGGAVGSPTKG